jgi:hypothetical protein
VNAVRRRVGIIVPFCLLLAACATVQQKTESYILTGSLRISLPINACLAGIDIVSNDLPLAGDYGLIADSLVAMASRHGIHLSPTRGDQPYSLDLSIHEHSSADDLATRYSVMAVLDVCSSADESHPMARVVHSAVMRESAVSLYRVAEISERLLTAMEKAMTDASRAAPTRRDGS